MLHGLVSMIITFVVPFRTGLKDLIHKKMQFSKDGVRRVNNPLIRLLGGCIPFFCIAS